MPSKKQNETTVTWLLRDREMTRRQLPVLDSSAAGGPAVLSVLDFGDTLCNFSVPFSSFNMIIHGDLFL